MYSKLNTPPGCLQTFKTKQRTRGKRSPNHIYGHSKKVTDKAVIGITFPIGEFQHSPKRKPFGHQAAGRSCLGESENREQMRQMTPGTTNPSPNQDYDSSSHSKSWFYHPIRGPQKSGAASITSTHQRFAEAATQDLIQELQPRSPKALCDLGQALLRLCSVRVEGTAVPGLQFWVGGAGGAAKRLDGLTVWLRIYWQGRISAKPGDTATMGIKSKNLLQTPPENIFICLSLAQVSWTPHTQSTSVTSF